MRLINANTLELEEFMSRSVTPKYAILSHRWEQDEVKLQQMQSSHHDIAHKQGFVKIKRCCEEALRYGLSYVWVDTCCIDKTSSAELSEAINSMYRWYQDADVCFAYLSDVYKRNIQEHHGELSCNDAPHSFIQSSVWFTRGWTLQELIAPVRFMFYDADWNAIGERTQFAREIEARTHIPPDILSSETNRDLNQYTVAHKMSWAAGRTTTREEDMAYCLLGIFDINMSLLYGEGTKAFKRLQEAIILQTYDPTIFVWSMPEDGWCGVLASSPDRFTGALIDFPIRDLETREIDEPQVYSFTTLGLSVQARLVPWVMDVYLAPLDCKWSCDGVGPFRVAIFVQKKRIGKRETYWRTRVRGKSMVLFGNFGPPFHRMPATDQPHASLQKELMWHLYKKHRIYLQTWSHAPPDWLSNHQNGYGFQLGMDLQLQQDFFATNFTTPDLELISGRHGPGPHCICLLPGNSGTVAVLEPTSSDSGIGAVKVGFDFDFNPVCFVAGPEYFMNQSSGSELTVLEENHDHFDDNDINRKGFINLHCMEANGWYEPTCSSHHESVLIAYACLPATSKIGLKFPAFHSWTVYLCDEGHFRCSAGKMWKVNFKFDDARDPPWKFTCKLADSDCWSLDGHPWIDPRQVDFGQQD